MTALKNLWAYLKSPLVKSKTAAASDEATVKSLSFMATTLLIIGLATSWLAIAPFIYSVVVSFAASWIAFGVAALVCLLISLLCDKPLGVFVPQFFDKVSNPENHTTTGIVKIISLFALSLCLSLLTMNLSKTGGTLTAKMLFSDKQPVQNGLAVIQNDSMKRAAITQVRSAHSKELEAAKATDKGILDKAAKAYETADYNAKKKFPQHKSHNWHKDEYNKAMQAAHAARTTAESYATHYTTANQKLSGAIYETTTAFEQKAAIDAENHKTKLADYERSLSVANALLRDLGYWSTPLFALVCGLMVVMGFKDGKKKVVKPAHELDKDGIAIEDIEVEEVDFWADAMKDIATYLGRLNEAVKKENWEVAKTNANNILTAYSTAKKIDHERFSKWMRKNIANNKHDILIEDDVRKFA